MGKNNKSDDHQHDKHDEHDHSHHQHSASCNHQNDNDKEEKKEQTDTKHNHHGHQHSASCNHGHGHSGGCQHDHDSNDIMSFGTSLYQFIDKRNIKCLNESQPNAGKEVFKPFDDRLDTSLFVESDIDGELLFTVYFTAEVQLRSIQLTMNDEESAPSTLKLWNDKQDKIDFDNHEEYKCSQSIELSFDNKCEIHWKTKQHKFNDLTVLKMLFKKDDYDEEENDEEIRLNYIGLKGDYKGPKSRRAVHAIYEAAANPNDHANIAKAKQENASKNDSVDGK